MPMTPFIGAIRGLGGELGLDSGLFGHFAVGDELHGTGQPGGLAGRIVIGLAAQAHPFVVPRLVGDAHLDVDRRPAGEMEVEGGPGELDVLRVDEGLEAFAGVLQLAGAVAQKFLEARADPGAVGGEVEFPHAVARAAHGARQALLHGVERELGAPQVRDVDHRPRDAGELAGAVVGAGGGFGDPALGAVGQDDAELAVIGRVIGGGVPGRAAHPFEVVGVHGLHLGLEIVEPGVLRDAEDLVEVRGREPAVAPQVEVHGGDPGHGLREVQGFGGVAQRGLELLAFGDVGHRADGARRQALGVAQHPARARQPAGIAARRQRAVLHLELAGAGDGLVQPLDHDLEVLRVNRGQPLVAREQRAGILDAGEFVEQRRAGDLAGDEVEFEHAEAARGLREFQEFGGAAQASLVGAAVGGSGQERGGGDRAAGA
jgi:hypothetical protein